VRQEANIISSRQVAEELMATEFSTHHSDGTSRNEQNVVDFEVTVDSGNRTHGLVDVAGGDADTQLSALKFTLQKLGDLLGDDVDGLKKTDMFNKLVSKIKNTMGEQAAAEKSFNRKLEDFRGEIISEIVENWAGLSDFEKSQMLGVSHFYCNLHVLGFADYCDSALTNLEQEWRQTYGKLGVEDLKEFQSKDGDYSCSAAPMLIQPSRDLYVHHAMQCVLVVTRKVDVPVSF
jgi:hypothetical protein